MEFSYLGASGAIYGLLGLYLFMAALRKDLIDHQNRTVIIVILVIGLVSTFIYPNTDILGHLFGLLAGFAFAPLFLIGIRNIVR
jgi:membrane associated rhomboid family serine protease